MEQHPIPQDVTGFQFKLIGSMTVKQFGYVAVGVIMAVILWYLPLKFPLAILAKIILIPLFGGTGVIIAFVPIEGRPVDIMATNFFNAVTSPNQYVYHKRGRRLSFNKIADAKQQTETKTTTTKTPTTTPKASEQANNKEQQLRALLMSSGMQSKNKLDEKEMSFLKNIATLPTTPTVHKAPPPPLHTAPPKILSVHEKITPPVQVLPQNKPILPTPPQPTTPQKPEEKEASLAQREVLLEKQLTQAKQEEAQSAPQIAANAHQKVLALETQIQEIHSQKEQLEQEVIRLKKQLQAQSQPAAVTPTMMPQPPKPAQPTNIQHVRNVPENLSKSVGLPHVSDTPNVIVGIVKDPRGNILPSILVEVKDKDGNPIRAFKTNPLGQFASATPLAPGSYTIELEDPKKQNQFDTVQIIANNEILLPIEIISHDAREQLRKELFN